MFDIYIQNETVMLFRTLFFVLLFSTFMNKMEVPIPSFSLRRKCHTKKLPVFQLFPIVIAVAIVWLFSFVLTVTDVFPSNSTVTGYKARTDSKLEIMTESPWFTLPLPRTSCHFLSQNTMIYLLIFGGPVDVQVYFLTNY